LINGESSLGKLSIDLGREGVDRDLGNLSEIAEVGNFFDDSVLGVGEGEYRVSGLIGGLGFTCVLGFGGAASFTARARILEGELLLSGIAGGFGRVIGIAGRGGTTGRGEGDLGEARDLDEFLRLVNGETARETGGAGG